MILLQFNYDNEYDLKSGIIETFFFFVFFLHILDFILFNFIDYSY